MISLTLNTLNLKEVEKAVVVEALKIARGNVSFARELLKIHKGTMYRFIKIHNLDDMIETLREHARMNDFSFNK